MQQVNQVTRLTAEEATPYVGEALRALRAEVGNQSAVLGFVGAPFTLASYIVEGGSSKNYTHIKRLAFGQPEVLHALLAKLAENVADYVRYQASTPAPLLSQGQASALPRKRVHAYSPSAAWHCEILGLTLSLLLSRRPMQEPRWCRSLIPGRRSSHHRTLRSSQRPTSSRSSRTSARYYNPSSRISKPPCCVEGGYAPKKY